MIKNYLTYIKENKGSHKFTKMDDEVLIMNINNNNRSIPDLTSYLNKEWIGWLKVSPDFENYYLHIVKWVLWDDGKGRLASINLFYNGYYNKPDCDFKEGLSMNKLHIGSKGDFKVIRYKKRDPLIKFDPILDPYGEEDWYDLENENIKLNENNELYDYLLEVICKNMKEKKIINFKDIINRQRYYYLFKEKSSIPSTKDIMDIASKIILESPIVNYKTIDGEEHDERVKEINILQGIGTTNTPVINKEGYVILFNRKEIDINKNIRTGIIPEHLKEIDPYDEEDWL